MRPVLLSAALASLFSLAACGMGAPDAGDPLPEEVSGNPGVIAWLDVWKTLEPGLSLEEFTFTEEAPIRPLSPAAEPTEDDQSAEARARYVFSADSLLFVDVMAYEGEPDSSVRVFNRNGDGRIETVAFCGTPCSFDAALWLDAKRAVVLGQTEDLGPDGLPVCADHNDPWTCDRRLTIDVYDMAQGTQERYVSPSRRFPRHPFAGG